jgi:putative phosphoribosyl transferase
VPLSWASTAVTVRWPTIAGSVHDRTSPETARAIGVSPMTLRRRAYHPTHIRAPPDDAKHGYREDPITMFMDRHDAGRQLAGLLMALGDERPIVIAVPRGGVPVAAEVALALDAPLDVLMVRKLGAPTNPEFAMGAIAEDGTTIVDSSTVRSLGVSESEFNRILAREQRELQRRVDQFRDGRAAADVSGRTVVLVDDGLATGLSDLAGVHALRARGARRIVVAAPVGSREAIAALREVADDVVCQTVPPDLMGVGRWYRDFDQVSDEEVRAILGAHLRSQSPPTARATNGPREVTVEDTGVRLTGDLTIPAAPRGLVIFAHGSGSSRKSPRNRMVAERLNDAELATLLIDLLAPHEEGRRDLVFDISFLARRLEAATRWAVHDSSTHGLPLGYFGASTGAGAALWAAAGLGASIRAIVSRGGRPDLAGPMLAHVRAPTLLIVGALDSQVLELNRAAAERLGGPHRIEVVPGASHLFEEPGTLDIVADLAADWFRTHLADASLPVVAA